MKYNVCFLGNPGFFQECYNALPLANESRLKHFYSPWPFYQQETHGEENVLDWQWLHWFLSQRNKQKGLRNQRTGSAQSIPKCSHSHAYHSCLGLVQSCLWRCLSTNWYHSGERRVLSGTKSSVHSIALNTIGLPWSAPALQNAHQPCSQSSSVFIS